MSTWNHRVVRSLVGGKILHGIHEVHYDDTGQITNWTRHPVSASGETVPELAEDHGRMVRAFAMPTLTLTDDGVALIEVRKPPLA